MNTMCSTMCSTVSPTIYPSIHPTTLNYHSLLFPMLPTLPRLQKHLTLPTVPYVVTMTNKPTVINASV